jgi:hypothetical protein
VRTISDPRERNNKGFDDLCRLREMAYCGIETTQAKIRWVVVVVFSLLGVGLIIGSFVQFKDRECKLCTPDGQCDERGGTYHSINGNEYYTNADGKVVENARASPAARQFVSTQAFLLHAAVFPWS